MYQHPLSKIGDPEALDLPRPCKHEKPDYPQLKPSSKAIFAGADHLRYLSNIYLENDLEGHVNEYFVIVEVLK